MLKFNQARKYVADFETTVYEGQESTEVWAAASVPCWSEDVYVFNCINDFLSYHFKKPENQIIYFHNLKFDGQFILDYLLKKGFKISGADLNQIEYVDEFFYIKDYKKMQNKSIYPLISDIGQWYMVVVKINNHIIEFRDSYKLLPFKVADIGKGFKTKHQKTLIEYTGERHAGGFISEEEVNYIKNDVLVVKEALEQLFEDNHTSLTIGSCCLKEFKEICKHSKNPNNPLSQGLTKYSDVFPDLTQITIPDDYGAQNADEYIRKSYHGGWCYVVDGVEGKELKAHGCTADVNSLYPSVMHSESGNVYPFGHPKFFKSEIPDKIINNSNYYYVVRFKCRFKIKNNFLPFIQIKNSFLYKFNEYLKTSDYCINGDYTRYLYRDGEKVDSIQEFTMTCSDFKLLFKHYDVYDFELLDGCYFNAFCGFFDDYINKYKKIKQESKGAKRTIAKLFLNNLYGKFATGDNSSYQVPILDQDNTVKYFTVKENEKKTGYIAVGAAVTSYARNFTISHAQENFHGASKPGFKYADTDSIHCDLPPDQLINITVHPTNFNAWKIENEWDNAIFVRQKTYIEHTIKEDGEDVKPYYLIKCAGMNQECKDLLNASITQDFSNLDLSKLSEKQKEFIKLKRTLKDFKKGLEIEGKLLPKKINGGIILIKTTFKMR